MASSREYLGFILEQLSKLEEIIYKESMAQLIKTDIEEVADLIVKL